jgi:hypothetical protein
MPPKLPVWRILMLRLPGFIGAAAVLAAAVLGNALASDEADFLSPSELTLWRLGALAFAMPLLLPWRLVTRLIGWRVLVGWLLLDAVIITSREVYQLVWLFGHRPLHIWAAYILPSALFLVAGGWMALTAALIARQHLGRPAALVRPA